MKALMLSGATGLGALRYVEAETSRLCNRTCSWCPNGHSSARREQQLMPWPLFTKVIAELGDAGYAGFLALHNFNEPLANPRLHTELAHIRAAAPDARPAIYTNGDLLNGDMLDRMLTAGVKYVRVTRYPHRSDVAPDFGPLRRWMRNAGLSGRYDWQFGPVRQGLAARWEDRQAGVLVELIRPSVATYNDRGGTALVPVELSSRTKPCRMTATSLSIDYRGLVKMCPNVIPDSSAAHEQYVVGSVARASLAELWDHPLMQDWRIRHGAADWSASPACRNCVQALPETRR
jgi:Radical SAM superfamily/Iron-sulfur cluster-binding domain